MNTLLNNKDGILMELVHYFVTEEDYTPINVQGAKDEMWLENLDGPYKIIRISLKHIHNSEQYKVDIFKMNYVVKQIKKKTLSVKMKALNIYLDFNDKLDISDENKYIDSIMLGNVRDIKKNKYLKNAYPNITTNNFRKTNNLDGIINVANDINRKTVNENDKYAEIFRPKVILITKLLIVICVIMYFISLFINDDFTTSLLILGANNRGLVLNGDIWRLFTSMFLHGSFIHLIVNMYSLWVVGSKVENYLGRTNFLIIYLLSGLMGSVFSIVFNSNSISIGASGAIFGLMGSLLYFGYYYRIYLSNTLINQMIPIIILNLILGFSLSGIDNAAHIGGLIGGYLATMIVGLKYKSGKTERINGIIVYSILLIFMFYILFKIV